MNMVPLPPPLSEAEWQEAKRRTDEWVAGLDLHGWLEVASDAQRFPWHEGQRLFEHRDGRRVIVTVGPHDRGWWLHVSVSRKKYIPSYADLADVKAVFVGSATQALQIFPRRDRHVNIHPTCLHLWARLDAADGLPDFGSEGTI